MCTVMYCLMPGIHSEKCIVRLFCHCANIRVTYIDLDGKAYYTPRLYSRAYLLPPLHPAYKLVQLATVLTTVGHCHIMVGTGKYLNVEKVQ